MAQYAMTKKGLAEALGSASAREAIIAEAYPPILDAISLLLGACERSGSISAGVTADDFFLVMHGLWRMDPRGDWRRQSLLLSDILVGGLQARGSRSLK
jgi:hypothetical protein